MSPEDQRKGLGVCRWQRGGLQISRGPACEGRSRLLLSCRGMAVCRRSYLGQRQLGDQEARETDLKSPEPKALGARTLQAPCWAHTQQLSPVCMNHGRFSTRQIGLPDGSHCLMRGQVQKSPFIWDSAEVGAKNPKRQVVGSGEGSAFGARVLSL